MDDGWVNVDRAWGYIALKTLTLPPATATNAIFVGCDPFVIVDPGAVDSKEQARLARVVDRRLDQGDRLKGIVLTHHHGDHIGGLRALLTHLETHDLAEVAVFAHPKTLDKMTVPTGVAVVDKHRLELGKASVELLHTPGHASGHMALWDAAAGVLAAGDMVASEGTILVNPPDGDMADYLASLERLKALEELRVMVPSHGAPIEDPHAKLQYYIDHRLMREARAKSALTNTAQSILDLLPTVYPEVPTLLYPLAGQSLLAHLIKLEGEGRAQRQGDHWRDA